MQGQTYYMTMGNDENIYIVAIPTTNGAKFEFTLMEGANSLVSSPISNQTVNAAPDSDETGEKN